MLKLTRTSLFILAGSLAALAGCGPKYADTGTKTVQQNRNDLGNCINEAKARNPGLVGQKHEMDLAFEIAPDGKVNRFNVYKDETKDPDFATCITIKARNWAFPPPPSGKMEQFTFKFNANF